MNPELVPARGPPPVVVLNDPEDPPNLWYGYGMLAFGILMFVLAAWSLTPWFPLK